MPWQMVRGNCTKLSCLPSTGRIVRMAHEDLAAHLGAIKKGDAICTYFFWPRMMGEVRMWCRCNVCQIAHNVMPTPVPLHPIPAMEEPFSNTVVDIVGPLPRTKAGNGYLLIIIWRATRYPEAIPKSSCMS